MKYIQGQHYHPSPQPSSSTVSFGVVSIFFATTGCDKDFGVITEAFFTAIPVPGRSFVAVVPLLVTLLVTGLARPLGNGFPPGFFWDCAANQPAKSGSPLSSNGVDETADTGFGFGF